MRCSVVIPCHNGKALTRACLESLLDQQGNHDLEILLVDNASDDDTASLADLDDRIHLVRLSTNRGFAGGVNAGLRTARHPFQLILNNDTQAASNLLDELHAAMASDHRIGAVAPVSNFVKGPACLGLGDCTRDPELREAVAAELRAVHCPLQDVDSLAGLCLLLRQNVIEEVGLFDERFGHGNYEDDDYCLRMRLLGYRLVIARRALLHHEGHATFHALGLDVPAELQKRREQFAAKWLDDPAGRATLAAISGQVAVAADEAREARSRWPRWPDADWHQGRQCLASGDHDGAIRHFEALLQACPFHTDAAVELAIGRLQAGDLRAAHGQLSWTAENCHVPVATQGLLAGRIGEHWYSLEQWDAAAQSFGDALELRPDDGALHNWIGSCRLQQGRLEAAIDAFTAAVDLDFPLAHTNLGICAHRRGDLETAERQFVLACERLPEDRVAQANLAMLRRQLAHA
ncbi:MAG: glycosyltransferase [Planctomycetes bacterium]|nr:glycosyltransferase [Planctomycetota bacterium]